MSQVNIDHTLSSIAKEDLPDNALKDIHHLLKLGFHKTNKEYDSLGFQMYYDPNLKDSIRIQSNGHDSVFVTIGNRRNKSVALYSYLDILKYRFYGPEDHWIHIPELKRHNKIDTVINSFFKFRNLSPSYGVSRSNTPVLDSAQFRFNRWKNRLRMGSLYNISSGHYGSTFIRKYKDEINKHPEWRGKNSNGEYKKWKNGLKLCYLHPGVIDLYKKDALGRLNNLKNNSTPPYFINMEPPDGDGFCECEKCPSVSDQVYGLANEVANYLYKIDTNIIVNLYGYNQHAEAPSFTLHKNILVGIVPYAFQSLGSPEKMMQEWESTGAKLYLRDYLAIPIWSYDRATFSPTNNSFVNKIQHLRDKNYWGYTFETTASFMAIGLNFYLLSKASWQNIEHDVEYELFLKFMFPGFEKEVSLVIENLPFLEKTTFADALTKTRNLIKKSSDLGNSQLTIRLQDLEFYIEYLYLLDKFLTQKSDENFNVLLNKIMSKPGSRLLHPYGLFRVLKRIRDTDRTIQRTPNMKVEIESPIQLTLRRRVQKIYSAQNPDFILHSLDSLPTIPVRNTKGILYVGNNSEAVKFQARVSKIYQSGTGTIVFRDMDNKLVEEISLKNDNHFHTYNINLSPNRFYNITFMTPSSVIDFRGFSRPFAFSEPLFNRYLNRNVQFYFKIPESVKNAILKVPTKSNEVSLQSNGTLFFKNNQFESYNINIKNKSGQVIQVNTFRHGIELLNIPHLLSLHPEAVIFQSNFK